MSLLLTESTLDFLLRWKVVVVVCGFPSEWLHLSIGVKELCSNHQIHRYRQRAFEPLIKVPNRLANQRVFLRIVHGMRVPSEYSRVIARSGIKRTTHEYTWMKRYHFPDERSLHEDYNTFEPTFSSPQSSGV